MSTTTYRVYRYSPYNTTEVPAYDKYTPKHNLVHKGAGSYSVWLNVYAY